MKFIVSLFIIFTVLVNAQNDESNNFNEALAMECEADDYGMKQYVLAFLKTGSTVEFTQEEKDSLQRAHMNNIGRLAEEGKLVVAGPFINAGELRGLYLFNTSSIDSARLWTSSDPAIQAQSLTMELHSWYGSAALMKVNDIHQSIQKISH